MKTVTVEDEPALLARAAYWRWVALVAIMFAAGVIFVAGIGLAVARHRPNDLTRRAQDFCMGVAWRLHAAAEHGQVSDLRAISETDEPHLCTARNLSPTIEDAKAMDLEIRKEIGIP